MSLLHRHYSLTGQQPEAFVTDMFNKESPEAKQRSKPPRRNTPTNTHRLIRNYDHSSPLSSPPMSRSNSVSSIKSTRSEPTWDSDYSHDRRSSVASSTKSTSSTRSLRSFFKKDKDESHDKKKKSEKIVLTSRHAAAVKTKMMLDPNYKEFMNHHRKSDGSVETAGVRGTENSHHLTAAEQEARHPHSGPPNHSTLSMPALTRIVSGDEEDNELDSFELQRRQWEESKKPSIHDIEEHSFSRQNSADSPPVSGTSSPRRTPTGSRESSPNRLGGNGNRPSYRTKNSWGAGYKRNDHGVWTKKDVQILPLNAEHPNALAESLDRKLRVS